MRVKQNLDKELASNTEKWKFVDFVPSPPLPKACIIISSSPSKLGAVFVRRCSSLRRVTFGPCLSLERIGVSCFKRTGVEEAAVQTVSCVVFASQGARVFMASLGSSSSLERTGVGWLQGTGVAEVSIPDSVRGLCDCCFRDCESQSTNDLCFLHTSFSADKWLLILHALIYRYLIDIYHYSLVNRTAFLLLSIGTA